MCYSPIGQSRSLAKSRVGEVGDSRFQDKDVALKIPYLEL